MSEEEKVTRGRSKKDPDEKPPEDEAGSPGPGPMGSGDPEAGESGPMGTRNARTNEDAASRDRADEGDS